MAADARAGGHADVLVVIDLTRPEGPGEDHDGANPPRSRRAAILGVVVVLGVLFLWILGGGGGDEQSVLPEPEPALQAPPRPDGAIERPLVSHPALVAAEAHVASPSRQTLFDLFDALGGFEGLELGVATGAFDVVTFDALDTGQVLAVQRRGYGPAQNQDTNEVWHLGEGELVQELWRPEVEHDFAHFNVDGTTTMWVHGGGDGFAPRAIVFDREGQPIFSSAPMFADRFAADAGAVFALIGYPDWYSSGDGYVALVADDGTMQHQLGSGELFSWIDVPTPGLLVAYPADRSGSTAAWDTSTLEPLRDHPLVGRSYQGVAISGDGSTALGVTSDGELEPLDLTTGRVGERFGHVDVSDVDRPVALADDGQIAVTVAATGEVTIWWVGDDVPIGRIQAATGLSRWVPSMRSARVTSTVAPDASRVAIQRPAQPGVRVSWAIVDLDVGSWIQRACALNRNSFEDGSVFRPPASTTDICGIS